MAGIYIHIPFCKQACHYCDFHFSTNQNGKNEMLQSIISELQAESNYLKESKVNTIYIGGGTPSLLSPQEVDSILNTIYKKYNTDIQELTFEVNPDDVSKDYIQALKKIGVNRLSLGIQSFDEEVLKYLNRAHNEKQAIQSLEMIQNIGYESLNADLIFGIPGRNKEVLKNDVQTLMDFEVDHISSYSLSIEENTVFGNWSKKGKFIAKSDEAYEEEFFMLKDLLAKGGFEQYETSNYCRNEKYAKHNTSYWKGQAYLGIGPSAHSYNGDERKWNVSNNALYIKGINEGVLKREMEVLSSKDKYHEFIMTGLRTKWGVDIKEIEKSFPEYFNQFISIAQSLIEREYLTKDEDIFRINSKHILIGDSISSEFFI